MVWDGRLRRARTLRLTPGSSTGSEQSPPRQNATRRARARREHPRLYVEPVPTAEDMILSNELRPGGNRPGPEHLWSSFDITVDRLALAMEGNVDSMGLHRVHGARARAPKIIQASKTLVRAPSTTTWCWASEQARTAQISMAREPRFGSHLGSRDSTRSRSETRSANRGTARTRLRTTAGRRPPRQHWDSGDPRLSLWQPLTRPPRSGSSGSQLPVDTGGPCYAHGRGGGGRGMADL